jgi:hypothetical protein
VSLEIVQPLTLSAANLALFVTIRIRYRILNARLAAGAVSGGGVDQAYDGLW